MSSGIVLGLTGPTGSGKSTVCSMLCENGFVRIDADKIAREVVEKGSPALTLLAERFSHEILNEDGTLNRKKLAEIAFSSSENTKDLNDITHPFIIDRVKVRIDEYKSSGQMRIVYDAPLLLESGTDTLCDKILVVTADLDVRKARIKRRDNLSDEEIEKRVNAQHRDSFYTEKSDYVIINNGDTISLSEQVQRVFFELTR
ncbi:MAG: dephospho-CoA kinase [Ruminococcus sp.]|nr:dephospho-CoA kinase [Ruminococcus sp.]